MAGDNYRFAESDSLLCYHGPMLYEAKCLKRRKTSDGKAQYFIHYKGWNSKWEEWVDDDRVLTVNTVNMNKMASLKEIHSNSKKGGAKRSITVVKEEVTRNVTPPIKGRKRKHSEISSESNQTVNVSSPAEPKPKKRGRPPKSSSSKIEPNEVLDTSETISTTETVENAKLVEVIKVTRSSGAHKTAAVNKSAEINKVAEVTKAIEETEAVDSSKEVLETNIEDQNDDGDGIEIAELTESNEAATDEKITEVVESSELIEETQEVELATKVELNKSIEDTKEVLETEALEIVAVEETDTIVTDGATETLGVNETLEIDIAVNDASETEKFDEAVLPAEENEECEVTESIEKNEATEALDFLWLKRDETVESVEEIETTKSTEEFKETGTINSIEELEEVESTKSTEESQGNETINSFEESEGTELMESFEELEETEDVIKSEFIEKEGETSNVVVKTELIEEFERDPENIIFTVPAPVEKILPVINIPLLLKRRIAYDFNMTTKFNKILKFPEKYTVEKLIRAYICSKSKAQIEDYDLKQTNKHRSFNIGLTLMQYFNILVHSQLLYLKEKEYGLLKKAKACLKKKTNSEEVPFYFSDILYPKEFWHYVYSPTYLLRLFIIMPQLLTTSMFNNQQLAFIALNCEDFLKFVESKYEIYFTDDDYI